MKKTILSLLIAFAAFFTTSAVTLNVNVPQGTKACFVVGKFNGWDPTTATPLTKVNATTYKLTDNSITETALCEGYKYICGPGWAYVEKGPNGEEIADRTTIGNPDVVASWAAVYDYNENIKTANLKVNGYNRKVEILLPEGYESGNTSYPVLYYVGVQQRYNKAGDDGDAGDNFFGSISWDVASHMKNITFPAIVVSTYSFVAENIPYPNPDFMGSGQSDAYLNDFINVVMKYVNDNYRTIPSSSWIMGADLGGVLATYAGLTYPTVFSRCGAMSPMYWICDSQLEAAARSFNGDVDFFISYGTKEPAVMAEGVENMCQALSRSQKLVFTNGTHDDESWGTEFTGFYNVLSGSVNPPSAPISIAVNPRAAAPRNVDIANTQYQLHGAIGSSCPSELPVDNEATFSLINNYRKGGANVNAKVAVRDIAASVKSKYFWNVARLPENQYLLSSPKDVSFSSKKTNTSWLRIVILENETVENVAASSAGFKVKGSNIDVKMNPVGSAHQVKADVTFTADKSFNIHYGSVNSESDMGAITENYSVSSNCTGATILYDFASNQVSVTETSWGDVIADNINISAFSAVPSFTTPGETSHITINLDEPLAYSATLSASHNYGSVQNVPLTTVGTNRWIADLSGLQSGIYTLSLNLARGTASATNVASINIKVLDSSINYQQVVSVNAYQNVDWTSFNQYKGNFHTHTSQSFDTQFRTDEVVDRYHNAGYSILALTDHDANPYPWSLFDLYNPQAQARMAETMGMLAIPGVELSKDNRNNWNEITGGEFNHHNDFFTGRKGQEFASLRESYAYTNSLGGMQIINHPGQYWNLSNDYANGGKNSPDWHAENFKMFPSLVGLEVYNQGNRRPNDRILWDQILDRTMPERPVWGYSCDDTHTAEQYFRNYDFMLMPELTVDALKKAMRNGALYFCYEYTGSGNALCPRISEIIVNNTDRTITIDTDATDVKWISSTDKSGGASTRKSTVVGIGKTFDFTGFKGKYVRALITNSKGETCTQPFGFGEKEYTGIEESQVEVSISLYPNPATEVVNVTSSAPIDEILLYSVSGTLVNRVAATGETTAAINVSHLPSGLYIVTVITDGRAHNAKLIKR